MEHGTGARGGWILWSIPAGQGPGRRSARTAGAAEAPELSRHTELCCSAGAGREAPFRAESSLPACLSAGRIPVQAAEGLAELQHHILIYELNKNTSRILAFFFFFNPFFNWRVKMNRKCVILIMGKVSFDQIMYNLNVINQPKRQSNTC